MPPERPYCNPTPSQPLRKVVRGAVEELPSGLLLAQDTEVLEVQAGAKQPQCSEEPLYYCLHVYRFSDIAKFLEIVRKEGAYLVLVHPAVGENCISSGWDIIYRHTKELGMEILY